MEEKQEVKRSSSEQRKLRSRDAARCRRGQETEVFYELAHTLPLPRKVSAHLDKAGIIRVALSFLRLRRFIGDDENQKEDEEEEEEEEEEQMDALYPQTLAGFVMVMTEEGDMIFLSEDISKHVGITQLELLGHSVYDFIHPCDQEELRDLLSPRPGFSRKPQTEQQKKIDVFLRMKSTITTRGRTVNIKSATWKVLHCTGHLSVCSGSPPPPAGGVLTLLCEPLPHPSSVEFPLDGSTFMTRHSMDLRFTHCAGRVTELVGYEPDDLIGRSAYEFHHALDSKHVNQSLHTLMSKGQVSTGHYRFLANSGGFVWAKTQATVLYHSKTSQPEAVVCLNFILSAVEQPDVVFSVEQTRCSKTPKQEAQSASPSVSASPSPSESCETSDPCDPERMEIQAEDECSDLYLKLKENPEELLQLAPEAGDAVVLLNDSGVLSFARLPSPDSVPDHPQDLCSPQLRQLLSPIFNDDTPPSSSSSSPPQAASHDPQSVPNLEAVRSPSQVEKFFAVCEDDGQAKKEETNTDQDMVDLDMLAPYISMDDDFQLTFLSLPEDDDTPPSSSASSSSSSSPHPSFLPPAVKLNRKRSRLDQEADFSNLGIEDKRQKHDSSIEELLLCHRLLSCLDETDQSELDLGPGGRSQLLTDRDPILGGVQGLCETAALMRDMYMSRPPDLSPPLSPLT